MTKQITIKLNHDVFRPVLDKLQFFGGSGITTSDSDLAAKCIYLAYHLIYLKTKNGKTRLEVLFDALGEEQSESVLRFLNEYYRFKKRGGLKNTKNGN